MCIVSILTSEAFWIFITACATVALACIANRQFGAILAVEKKNAKVVSATFINNFKNSFFSEQERVFILLIEKGFLKFDSEAALFENTAPNDFKSKFPDISFLQRSHYLTQEIDDYLLGHFEDAALLRYADVIQIEDANEHFEYYLSTTLENEEIKKYIKWAQQDDSDFYKKSEDLYNELNNKS